MATGPASADRSKLLNESPVSPFRTVNLLGSSSVVDGSLALLGRASQSTRTSPDEAAQGNQRDTGTEGRSTSAAASGVPTGVAAGPISEPGTSASVSGSSATRC